MQVNRDLMNDIYLKRTIDKITYKILSKRTSPFAMDFDADFSKNLYFEIVELVSKENIGSLVMDTDFIYDISNKIFWNVYENFSKDLQKMKKPSKKSFKEIKNMSLEELENYMFSFRKYKHENNIKDKKTGVVLRKLVNAPLVKFPLLIDRLISRETVEIFNRKYHIDGDYNIKKNSFLDTLKYDFESRFKTNGRPIIYAVSHIGDNDIQRAFNTIPRAAYLLLGDPMDIYRDVNGILLNLNGSREFEIRNFEDRKIVKARMEHLLSLTPSNNLPEFLRNLLMPNLIMFPEGVWNLDDCRPMLDIYNGVIDLAIKTNSDIIPVALDLYDKKSLQEDKKLVDISLDFQKDKNYMVNFGDIITPSKEEDINVQANHLRDKMATLKWYMWETIYKDKLVSRDSITTDYQENFAQKKLDLCPYFYIKEQIEETKCHLYKTPHEIKATLENIIPNKNNSYIFKEENKLKKLVRK